MKRYLIVALVFIYLMINGVEHLCMHLLAICCFSLVKHPLESYTDFNIGFVILLLNCRGSLCILDINSLLDI